MGGFHKQRLIIFCLCVIAIVSVFMPWVKNPMGKNIAGIATTGFQSWGALLSLAGAVAILFQGDKSKALTGFMKYLAIGLCGVATLFGTYKVLDTIGFGLILMQIASLGGLFAAIYIGDKEETKDSTPPPAA